MALKNCYFFKNLEKAWASQNYGEFDLDNWLTIQIEFANTICNYPPERIKL